MMAVVSSGIPDSSQSAQCTTCYCIEKSHLPGGFEEGSEMLGKGSETNGQNASV